MKIVAVPSVIMLPKLNRLWNEGCAIEKMTVSTIRPPTAGSEPISPPRTRWT